jgi:hypothetical protein
LRTMNKTYSLIFLQHCNKTIQDRITGHPEFDNKIENDPIELLKAIEILINDCSLMTGLTTQYSMGVNMFPENVVKAIDILTNHRFDKKEPKNNNNNQKNKNRNDDDTASTITTQSSFNQEEAKNAQCYCCGKKGHYANKCPEKGKRPKDQWAVKKAMMHAQAESEKESDDKEDDDNASKAS